MIRFLLIFLSIICQAVFVRGQSDSLEVIVRGSVRDERDQPIANTIIINRRTKTGQFGNPDGSFTVRCLHTDTLSITSLGYMPRFVRLSDSIPKKEYTVKVYLEQRVFRLPEVEIFAPRDLERIQAEISRLGYNEEDYRLSGINAAMSPITFLYQQFSRREQSRRQVAQMENADRRRELLKELFHHYVDYDIIELDDTEFDSFIDYLQVSDEFLKSSSQYDFLVYVKEKFRDYRIWKRRQGLRESDFNYDQD